MPYRKPEEHDTVEKKFLANKSDFTIKARLRGIDDPEVARRFIEAEVELAEERDRDVRNDLIGTLNAIIDDLEDR